ncbi:MAG: polysaccharide pyruvyl transferase CsaB [Oscillospiraceae bacterium]|nr:polysaccharide pyruvyl transferase CsaB [Oscillospiraceae bacterium]
MKIIHMIGGGDVGGAKTHVLSLVSKLSETNEVVLVSFREGEFASDARALGIDTRVIKSRNPIRDLKELKNLICGGGFDIVHCHGAKANVMAAMIKHHIKVPVITTVHSDYRLDYLGSIKKRLTNGLLNTAALRFLDGYIGVTNAFSDLLIERGFDPYKLYTLNNGIDFEEPFAPKMTREEYLSSLGIKCTEDTVVCAIAARFHPVKDIPTAVRAIASLADEFPGLYLVLGGDGEEAENLKSLVSELNLSDRVVFAGWIDDMDSFLNAADVSIISSVSEGFPYSILESIRAKCTMVSTKVGAMPEVIDDGENGLLFDVGDVRALAEHIRNLCENPAKRKEMAEKLFEKACEKYSFEAMVKAQLSIYDKALNAFKSRKKRDGKVIICGSYGRGNAGDDAILSAVIREIYEVAEDAKICVMSKKPKQTKLSFRTDSIYTFNVFRMISRMRRSCLYINGGGSLIQDNTSSRSLYFYLMTLIAARICGADVMMYGCGIGPVKRVGNRKLAAKIIDKNVDCITLRDPDSFDELCAMGVRKPRMQLAADPTLGISPVDEKRVEEILQKEGVDLSRPCLCLAMRNWKGIDEKICEIARAADYAAGELNLSVVLLPMERKKDIVIAERIRDKMEHKATIITGGLTVPEVIGVLSKMRLVAAMRLHALVFAAGQGVATIGIAYDHKVTGFMNYIGREMCVQYEECTAEILKSYIDRTINDTKYSEDMKNLCRTMRENEKENVKNLRVFLDKGEV